MTKRSASYLNYIYSGRLTLLTDKIAELEDEFKICLMTDQNDKAQLIECILGEHYKLLMHEVRKQGLTSILITENTIEVTFSRIK